MAQTKQEILNRAKDRHINNLVEDGSRWQYEFISNVLYDYFEKDVAKMNTEEFKEYLENEIGYDEDLINSYFED
jgi:predicted metal-dependent peptidase